MFEKFLFVILSLSWMHSILGNNHNGFHLTDIFIHCIQDSPSSTNDTCYYVDPIKAYHELPNQATLQYLQYKLSISTIKYSTREFFELHKSTYHLSKAIPNLANLPEDNSDNILYKHMILFESIQNHMNLFQIVKKIPRCPNPTIARLNSIILLGCRSNHPLGGPLSLAWLDEHYNIYNHTKYGLPAGYTQYPLDGEDYRMIPLSQHEIILFYVFFYQRKIAQIKATKLYLVPIPDITDHDHNYQLMVSSQQYHLLGNTSDILKNHQKNWCNFVNLQQNIVFMHTIAPMKTFEYNQFTTISSASSSATPSASSAPPLNPKQAAAASTTNFIQQQLSPSQIYQGQDLNITWLYGQIKGGTPALLIDNNTYFGFFHSKEKLTPSTLITYVFGAFTFSATPPYDILSFSRVPLVHRSFYEGKWSKYVNYVDYILFPMSFIFKDPEFDPYTCHGKPCWKKNNLIVSVGYQDQDGYLLEANLLDILKTLVPVSQDKRQ